MLAFNLVMAFLQTYSGAVSFNAMIQLMRTCQVSAQALKQANPCFKVNIIPITPNILSSHAKPNFNRQANPTLARHSDTPLEALLYIIAALKNQGIYVLIDMHNSQPNNRQGRIAYGGYTAAHYLQDIATIASLVKTHALTNVVGIDLYNEPHALDWGVPLTQTNLDPLTLKQFGTWREVIDLAAHVLYTTNPQLLVFVEGATGDKPFYNNADWGENFQPLARRDTQGNVVYDPTQFPNIVPNVNTSMPIDSHEATIESAWLKTHLVFAPHVYPQSVGHWQPASQTDADNSFTANFGFLSQHFPVFIGEFGSYFKTSNDQNFMRWLATYMAQHGEAQYFTFWTWNENSGDTGAF